MKRKTPPTTAPTVIRTVRKRRRRNSPPPGEGDVTAPGRARRAPVPQHGARPAGVPPRLGPYRLIKVLGEGGMGTVYLAEETENLRRKVAVKWIRTALVGEAAKLRFSAERRALARMNHPSIAQIFEAGTDDEGRPYIVMEHVPGGRITEYCQRQEPTLETILGLLADLARGLLHAHRQGILHRDIKPSNVLVGGDPDEGPVPKIIDFGLAKLLDATVQLTRPGDVLGTPAYMPPEQFRGEPVDRRSDIYAFGVMIRELLTGDPEGVLSTATYPSGLVRLVEKCVAPDPAERYDEVAALVDDLEHLRSGSKSVSSEDLSDIASQALSELFETDPGPGARHLLEILEGAATHGAERLLRTLEEAGRQSDAHRQAARWDQLRVEAAAEYQLGSALQHSILGDPDSTPNNDARTCFEQALSMYREILEALPDQDAEDYVHLGDLLLHLTHCDNEDDLQAAADAYQRALDLDDKLASARYGLALAGLLGHAPAIEWLGDAWRLLELDPESISANNHLGVVLLKSHHHPEISLYGHDKLREAISAFEKALELGPDQDAVHFNLELVLQAQEEARQKPEEMAFPRLILPYLPEPSGDSLGDSSSDVVLLQRQGQSLAQEDPEAARRCFVRAERLRRLGDPS